MRYLENYISEKIEYFRSMAVIDNDVYFLAGTGDRFYKAEVESGNIAEVQEISKKQYAYCEVVGYHECLIFVPAAAEEICIYNTGTKEYTGIVVPDSNIAYDSSYKFSNAFVAEDKVFLMPHFYPDMIIWDMQAGKMYSEHRIYEEFVERKLPDREFFSTGGIVVHNKIYVTPIMENMVLEIDATSCNIQFYEVGKQEKLYTCIAYDGNDVWLAGQKETLTKWNTEKGTAKEYDYPMGFKREKTGVFYLSSFTWGNKIVLVPQLANMFVEIDAAKDKVSGMETGYGIDNVGRYIVYDEQDGKTWIYNNADQQLVSYCSQQDIINKVKVGFHLKDFLSKICKCGYGMMPPDDKDGSYMVNNIGRNIYYETSKDIFSNKSDKHNRGNCFVQN